MTKQRDLAYQLKWERLRFRSPLKNLCYWFGWAFERHCDQLHLADYEVCHDPVCRVSWWFENWLWYGGKAEF